jgi:hypothetical protein
MNHEIANILRDKELMGLRTSSYVELQKYIAKPVSKMMKGPDGQQYQVEIQAFWDKKKDENIRVTVSVDDGSWAAVKPLSGDFIISPDGSIV